MTLPHKLAIAATLSFAAAAPAAAIQHVVTLNGLVSGEAADQRYEFAGDFLQTHYGLTTGTGSPVSYLPPLERAVAESRSPNSGRTRGFHQPNNATGRPVADGGTGVVSALTNAPSLPRTAGQGVLSAEVSRAWVSNQVIGFTLTRTGTTVTYSTDNGAVDGQGNKTQPDDVWSITANSIAEINAFQFRIRSAGQNAVSLSNVKLVQGLTTTNLGCSAPGTCGVGLTGAFSASAGDVHISLFDQLNGNFTLSGNWIFNLAGGRAGNNAQIKLLSVPVLASAVPEPASWAMLIAGFGLVGTGMRRRRTALA